MIPESTSRHISATLSPPATRQKGSRSLSPKKRSVSISDQKQQTNKHSSLSPRRRKESPDKPPRGKSRNSAGSYNENDGPQNVAGTKPSERTAKASVKDFDRVASRHEDFDSGSSDEALEFTKERYKRRKSHTTNRPDVAPVTRPKQHSKTTSNLPLQKSPPIHANPGDETGSVQRTAKNPSSSDSESSSTGASITEAEKGRLRRQLKRRAILKRKAAQASKAKRDSMSFLDIALAHAASDFVSNVIGQLGLGQPFVFPTSPLAGESELNEEYNLLRWEDDLPSKAKPTKKVYTGSTLLEDLLGWKTKKDRTKQSIRPHSSHDITEDTERSAKGDVSVDEKPKIKFRKNSITTAKITIDPSMQKGSEPIIITVKRSNGSRPAKIDNKDIVNTAQNMTQLEDIGMRLDNGDIQSLNECPTTAKTSTTTQKESGTIIKTVKGSGPAVIDETEIAMVARSMATLQDISMTSDDGDLSGDSSSESKDNGRSDKGQLNADKEEASTHRTDPTPLPSENLTVAEQPNDFDFTVSSDSEDNLQSQQKRPAIAGDDDINSLTYSIEDKARSTPEPPLCKNVNEDSSVAKLIQKFEKEPSMRSRDANCVTTFPPKQRDSINDLAVALSLSADDSLLPYGNETPTYPTLMVEDKAESEAKKNHSTKKNRQTMVSDNHMDELLSKTKEYQERRGIETKSFETTRDEQVPTTTALTASTEGGMSKEPEFIPQVMIVPSKFSAPTVDTRRTVLPIVKVPQICQEHTPVNSSRPCQLICAKLDQGVESENMSASFCDHACVGGESLGTGFRSGPVPVDIDVMVSKIDGMVQRLISAGKLPRGESNNSLTELEQRMGELLRNLAVLKKRRRSTGLKQFPPQVLKPSVPLVVECDRQLQKPNPRISTNEPPASSPSTPIPILPTMGTKELAATMISKTDPVGTGIKPFSNLARIRARRDEAVMRIKEKTQKLSGFTNPINHTGPIPIRASYISSHHCVLERRESSNADMHNDRDKEGNPTPILSKNSKLRGPPRPEVTLALRRENIAKVTFQNPLSRNTKATRSRNQNSSDTTYGVPMSTSDLDMEEWENNELEKLPLLLSKTKSEEQGDARFSTINYDSRRLTSSAHRQNLRHETSVIDECDDTEEEDTEDTDSTSTFGSESDSDRLDRIASMIHELRLRRQRRL
jgi:hypothetical protein